MRTCARKVPLAFWLPVLFLCLAPAQAVAQAVVPVRGIDFGLLMPGTAETVTVRDAWRRGEARIEATGAVEIRILLPAELTASGAPGTVPLRFQEGDAAIVFPKTGKVTLFDPRQPLRISIPASQKYVTLYLGGTATPPADQAAEEYSAPFVVVVSISNT